jgi:hypothetical protein
MAAQMALPTAKRKRVPFGLRSAALIKSLRQCSQQEWFMRLLLALLASSTVAAPTNAQFVGKHDYGPAGLSNPFIGDSRQQSPGIGRELRNVREQIRAARESGVLSGREARQLKRDARAIEHLAARYSADGLSAPSRTSSKTAPAI